MKRSHAAATSLLAAATLVLAACGDDTAGSGGAGGDGGQSVELRVTDIYSLEHSIGKNSIQPFMKAIEEQSDGRITFKYFPSEQLVKGRDIAEALSSGTADVGNVLYLGSANPLLYVAQLPGLFEDSEVVPASEALMEFVDQNESVRGKFDELGMKPLFCFTVTNYQLEFPEKGIKSFDQLRGQQIRAAGAVLPFSIQAIGATPVDVDISEAYDAFNRGVIDGIALSVPSTKSYGFFEILKSTLINVNLGGFPVCYAMSSSAWDSLSPEDQELLSSEGHKTVTSVAEALLAELEEDLKTFESKGIELNEVDTAERDKRLADVESRWIDKLVEDGVPAEEAQRAVDQWQELLDAGLS
jgi:TRAP-type C4-dicarboxylate transport system substrate-binding protein